jgi:DNA-binding NarL/FixJ family response regulator
MKRALSPRQREVLRALADGREYRDCAAGLKMSIGTFKTHVSAAYRKLGAANQAQAVYMAAKGGEI